MGSTRATQPGCNRSSEDGITLVETIAAVAIVAMVGGLVWGGLRQSLRNKQALTKQTEHFHQIHQTLERLQAELSMAYVSIHVNRSYDLRTSQTAFVGTDRSGGDRIDFTSLSHRRLFRDAHESDQNELSYFLADHPDGSDRRVLARREQRRVDEEPQKGGDIHIVLEDVLDFQLEYLDPKSLEWKATWDTTQGAEDPNRLPMQVIIRLTVPGPGRSRAPQTFATRASVPLVWALNHAAYNP